MSDDRLDRYARGELSAFEARELAHESAESDELFDELTAVSLAKAALPAPKPVFQYAAWGAIAAVLVAALLYVLKPAPSPPLQAALAWAASPGQPALLADPPADFPVFRGADSTARAPRLLGTVMSIEAGEAAIDLGSIDGLDQGMDLEASSGGRVKIGTLFRDRALGKISGQVRPRDEIRVPTEAHLRALADQGEAAIARDDLDAARDRMSEARAFFESAKLGGEAGSRLAFVWNELGVRKILRGDSAGAEVVLQQAVAFSPAGDGSHARALNNLGVIAELRGDRARAAALYQEALGAAPERHSVEANLARVKGSR